VTLWNARDGTRIGTPLKIESGVAGVFFQADGTVAVVTAQGAVRLVNPSGAGAQPEIVVSQKEVKSIAASGNGSIFAVGNQDASIAVWPFPAGPVKWLAGHAAPVLAMAFSPGEGKYLVTADGNGSAIGWDIKSGNPAFHADTKDHFPFTAVAISPDARAAVTGDSTGMLRVWEVPSGRPLDAQPHGVGKRIEGAAFSANGHTLLSAGIDGRLKFWNVLPGGKLGDRLTIPCGAGDRLHCTAVAFLADGQTAAVAGLNGGVRLYPIEFAKLFDEARNLVDPRQIDPQGCVKFLHKSTCDVPSAIGPVR
jgi:WD40 repeat protein